LGRPNVSDAIADLWRAREAASTHRALICAGEVAGARPGQAAGPLYTDQADARLPRLQIQLERSRQIVVSGG